MSDVHEHSRDRARMVRSVVRDAALALLLTLHCLQPGSAEAAGSSWKPARPVALIVGAAPGGSIDLTARVLQRLWDDTRIVQSPVIVINKPGAGNGIAWAYLNERGADGHSISIGTTNLVTNEIIGAHKLGYRDVTPLAVLFDDYMALVVRADSPLKTWKDVAERLRRDPGSLSVAFGPSLGSGGHTGAAVAVKSTGAAVAGARFVAYKSVGEALAAMFGGQIDIVCGTAANMPAHLQAGRIRVLGVTSAKRLGGALAQAPTFKEQGFEALFTNWRAVIGPKNHAARARRLLGTGTCRGHADARVAA
jgi:putative tricarboxylic transport membrane protein